MQLVDKQSFSRLRRRLSHNIGQAKPSGTRAGLEIFFVFFYVITNNYVYLSALVYISCGEKDHNQSTPPENYSDLKTRLFALSTTEVSKEAR